MRLIIRLTAYTIVLTIATVVVFAVGPCEESCDFNNTNCTTATNTNYSQCLQASNQQANSCFQSADSQWGSCYQQAESAWNYCMQTAHQQEQGICNWNLMFDQAICDFGRDQEYSSCWNQQGISSQICEQNFVLDQQQCANDYDNCLFICSTQNP